MTAPLNASQRRRLWRYSVVSCTVSALLLPLAARPGPGALDDRLLRAGAQSVPDVPPKLVYPGLTIRHDPFATPSAPPEEDGGLDPGIVLPPNAGAAANPVVRAVVLGEEPKALVDIDGKTRIVGVGTQLGEAVVRSISAEGVLLDDGERLPIEASYP